MPSSSVSQRFLQMFSADDIALYKLVAAGGTDNLDALEVALGTFLEHKDEIRKTLASPASPDSAADADPSGPDALMESGQVRGDVGERQILARPTKSLGDDRRAVQAHGHPSRRNRMGLRQGRQSHQSRDLPRDLAKDWSEAGDRSANGWARSAAGVGVGTKVAAWLLVLGGAVYAISWLVGVGEIVTLVAILEYGLLAVGALSVVEAELRVKAASQAKTPEEYREQIQKSATAMTNALMSFAMFGFARGLRFIAKTYFPKTLKSLENLAERMRNKIRIYNKLSDAKTAARACVTDIQDQMASGATAAKDAARAQAASIKALTPEEFARKLDSGELFEGQAAPSGEKNQLARLAEDPRGPRGSPPGSRMRRHHEHRGREGV